MGCRQRPDRGQATDKVGLLTLDLVVVVVVLADSDSFELPGVLRARSPQIALLFLTARDASQDRVHGVEIGADDYITKPFELSEVLARSRGLMRRAGLLRQRQGSQLQVTDLILEVDAHDARRAGRSLSLTTIEFALLRYLATHQRRVLSKEKLLRKVQGADFGDIRNTWSSSTSATCARRSTSTASNR